MPAIEASGAAAALEPSVKPVELSFPLPKAPETRIHVHLTVNATSIVLFLTTVYEGNIPSGAPLGSFVYALPDVSRAYSDVLQEGLQLQRNNPDQTLSTPLFTYESSVEFTTRLAKLLARRTHKPVYVGNSMSFASAGMGGTVEEEIEGFKKVIAVVMGQVEKAGDQTVNGLHDR
jgi:hypothetical protein